MHKTTLAQREQVLGDTHPQTLAGRNALPTVRSSCKTGKPQPHRLQSSAVAYDRDQPPEP
ncbi:hypothetical protein [Streptomyces mirabilis]|uniref:hypothetical protein n=1 Tax=Streptomyces mirabilis TaxID=68239 RepID=UPI00364D459E